MSEQVDREMEELHKKVMAGGDGGALKDVVEILEKEKRKNEKTADALATLVILLPMAFAVSAYAAWLLTYAWVWFVVPLGVPAVGFVQMWGLTTLVSFFTTKKPDEKQPDSFFSWAFEPCYINLVKYTLAFAMCYVLHRMM